MSSPSSSEVAAALREFAERIDALDPAVSTTGQIEIRVDGHADLVMLGPAVAHALVEALRSYHDPRDRGRCDHCGGARLDDNFLCHDCGQPSGVFGQMLRERAARYSGWETDQPR